MSLKTTPKGLLAALAALCIILMQLPAVIGGTANAAPSSAHPAAVPAHAITASHTSARSQDAAPVVPTTPVSFTANFGGGFVFPIPGSTAALTPTSGPAGSAITVTGVLTGTDSTTTTITVNITDASNTLVFSRTVPVDANGAFTVSTTLPLTIAVGLANITASTTNFLGAGEPDVAQLAFLVNGGFGANGGPSVTVSPPLTGVAHCVTSTLTLSNFVPGVPLTPTLVYSATGVTTTVALPAVTPAVSGPNTGNVTTVIQIPPSVPYNTTGVISVAASYPFTPTGGFPTFTTGLTPTVSTTPTGIPTGPFSGITAGTATSLTVSGTGFQPNTAIALTIGLSGTAGSALTPSAPITSNASGAFSGSAAFTPPVAGTYILTATDGFVTGTVTPCNVATTTVTVNPVPVPVAGPPASTVYFPEGYTGQAANNASRATFRETLDILNPNITSVVVVNTYLLETINEDVLPVTSTTSAPNVVVVTRTLPALADVRIDVATDISSAKVVSGPNAGSFVNGNDQKVATKVTTFGLTGIAGLGGVVRGVAVQRTIERTLASSSGGTVGNGRNDGDTNLGLTAPNTSYYFAEGYSGANFQEYLILLNPSSTTTATVSVLRMPEGGATTEAPLVDSVALAPLQRLTLNVRRLNGLSPELAFGLIVNSDNPILAERTEYFGPGNGSGKPGETIAAGLTTAAKQLNFAYGSLTAPAGDVAATFPPSAETAQTLDNRPFIEVVNPNIAGQVVAGTLSGSATAPGPAAHVTIQLRGENGRLLGFFFTDVDAGARFTLTANDLTSSSSGIGYPGVTTSTDPTGAAATQRAGVFSAVVTSSERVVAELAQYYGDANGGAPGLDLVGLPSGETDVLFPSLSSNDPAVPTQPLSQTVFLYNPGVTTIRVNGTFYGAAGVVAHQVYTIRPDRIQIIGNTTATAGTSIPTTSTVTLTGQPSGLPIPAGTTGAEFSVVQQRGPATSGEPVQAPEAFVAAAITRATDGSNFWGTQGLYPLPVDPSCATSTGQPLGGGCP